MPIYNIKTTLITVVAVIVTLMGVGEWSIVTMSPLLLQWLLGKVNHGLNVCCGGKNSCCCGIKPYQGIMTYLPPCLAPHPPTFSYQEPCSFYYFAGKTGGGSIQDVGQKCCQRDGWNCCGGYYLPS